MKLRADERVICGQWELVGGKVEADENCRRIEELTQRYLHEIARDPSGWDTLYVDPSDGRFWELTYPDSESHGGGPPRLECLPRDQAREKYGDVI
jgi:hypothetical protein